MRRIYTNSHSLSFTTMDRRKQELRIGAIGLVVFGVLLFALGFYVGVQFAQKRAANRLGGIQLPLRSVESILEAPRGLPKDARRVIRVTKTAYNPVKGQTDDSPCIGAWGDNLCAMARRGIRIIAVTPDLKLQRGTRVIIEGHAYYVYDRMPSRRYDTRLRKYLPQERSVDVFTFSREEAWKIGRREVIMEVR